MQYKQWVCAFRFLVHGVVVGCNKEADEKHAAKNKVDSVSNCVARVGDAYLSQSGLAELSVSTQLGVSMDDFEYKRLIETWACRQLLIEKGKEMYAVTSRELKEKMDKQVDIYHKDLLAYHFLEAEVQRLLETTISSQEIGDYYQQHRQADFLLPYDMVKGVFVVMPRGAVRVNVAKSLMLSASKQDYKKLNDYCKSYAHRAILVADQWFTWEEILAKTGYRPQGEGISTSRLLRTNKFIHVAGKKYVYLLKINQYKLAQQDIAPLEVVEGRIKAILLHKRKLALMREIERNLLENAKKVYRYSCYLN